MTNTALLHRVLQWTRSDAGFEDNPGKTKLAKARAKSIKKIIDTHPYLLTQHDERGIPPYQHAINIQAFFLTDEITKTLHTAIFDHLMVDPAAVRLALYTKSGKCVSSSLVYQC